jgi:hypothetical protein
MNRLTPVTRSAAAKNTGVGTLSSTSQAVPAQSTRRIRFPYSSVCRRRQRSSRTPAKGPQMQNGSSSTAKAEAMAPAVGWRSGEKTT